MSTEYRFDKAIRVAELFDGRLEQYGIYEKVIDGKTSSDCRLLKEGCSGLWIYGDEFVSTIAHCGSSVVNIVNAISENFDTYLVSEYDPRFWGFETQEEWDRAQNEMHKEDQAELYIEIMKYIRGESNDIKPRTNGEGMANIAKTLIKANPDLASPDNEETLMEMIDQECRGNHATSILLNEDEDIIESIIRNRYRNENTAAKDNLETNDVKQSNNNQDSLTSPFKLTMMFSDTGPVNQTIMLDDEQLLIDDGHDEIDGDLDVIDCNGLIQFKLLVESSSIDSAFILGCPQQDGEIIQSIGFTWCDERVTNARDQSLPVSPLHLLHFRANETSLMVFVVNNSGKDSPGVVWDILCEIDPQLKSVGYLLAYSPSSNIIDYSSGIELTGSENFHFYCLVKNGADIPRYGRAFVKRSWLQGYGRIELTESGEYLERQIVNVEAFHPNQTMCESPPTLGDGLIQNKPGMQLHAGGVLNTETLEDLNYIESLKYKGLVEETKNPSQESWVQARQSWLKMKSNEIEKFTGCGDVAAWNAAQHAGDTHILPGLYTLKFERFGWVTVMEVLFDAEKFDRQTLTDPICYTHNRFVATFEWNDGDPVVRSFIDGECAYRFLDRDIDVAVKYHALKNALTDVGAFEWGQEETQTIINLLYGDRDIIVYS